MPPALCTSSNRKTPALVATSIPDGDTSNTMPGTSLFGPALVCLSSVTCSLFGLALVDAGPFANCAFHIRKRSPDCYV